MAQAHQGFQQEKSDSVGETVRQRLDNISVALSIVEDAADAAASALRGGARVAQSLNAVASSGGIPTPLPNVMSRLSDIESRVLAVGKVLNEVQAAL